MAATRSPGVSRARADLMEPQRQGSGVYDLVGNAWEWVDMLIGTTDHTIDAEYPGRGSRAADRKRQHRDTLRPNEGRQPVPRGRRVLSGNGWLCRAEYDNDYYWQATGQRAAIRGGDWRDGAYYGLFCCT